MIIKLTPLKVVVKLKRHTLQTMLCQFLQNTCNKYMTIRGTQQQAGQPQLLLVNTSCAIVIQKTWQHDREWKN